MERRDFIKFLPAAFLAIAAGCRRPEEKIVPRIYPGKHTTPGIPEYFNTIYSNGNAAYGITVKTYEGRPVKIDGNVNFTLNEGRSNAQMQASLYSLYDPDRFFRPKINGKENSLENAIKILTDKVSEKINKNKKIRVLIGEHCSPSFKRLTEQIEIIHENIKFITSPKLENHNLEARVNNELFGVNFGLVPDLSKVKMAVSLGADILGTDRNMLYHTKQYTQARNENDLKMITYESNYTLTGAKSDQRYVIQPSEFELIAESLLYQCLLKMGKSDIIQSYGLKNIDVTSEIITLAGKMLDNTGEVVILTGDNTNLRTKYIAALLNYYLDSTGDNKPVDFRNIIPYSHDKSKEMAVFNEELDNGSIDMIFILNLDLENKHPNVLSRIKDKIPEENICISSLYPYQEFKKYKNAIPTTHYLESWGDAAFFDGTYAIQQPIIKPLNKDSISTGDLLLRLFANQDNYYDHVRKNRSEFANDEFNWENILRKGYICEKVERTDHKFNESIRLPGRSTTKSKMKLICVLSENLNTGEFYENHWLRELPDPVYKTTWENYAYINTNTANNHDLKNGDVIKIYNPIGSIHLPVVISDKIAENCIITKLGFKTDDNPVEKIVSFEEMSTLTAYIDISKTDETAEILHVNDNKLDNSFEFFKHDTTENNGNYTYKLHKWTMTVNIDDCTGCNACVIACQIENNIAVVGKDEIKRKRPMHWINIHNLKDKSNCFIPVMCQHCDNAPCETVCPVAATTHSPEGINEMTYNRCVGTRYCMANCPYDVRRFNFEDYHESEELPFGYVYNPNVTVRMRGIVEKCTFCVHRVNEARKKARRNGSNSIRDGDVQTACQQVCPAGAINFGNILDKESRVYRNIKNNKTMRLLEELNTEPSVYYIKKDD